LDAFEADATALRMLAIAENPIDGNFDLSHLQAIHRYIFHTYHMGCRHFNDSIN
jgi:cell filamentation protein